MRISSQLCLAVSWLGILISAEPAYPQRSEEAEQQRVSKEENARLEDKTAEESRQRYSIESDGFDTRVPSEFNLEISNLRIPVAEDLPRRIEGSNEEGGGEESPPNEEEEEEEDNNRSFGGDADLEEEVGEGTGDDRTGEEEVDEGRAGGSPDYDEYDSPPRNDIPYNSEESGSYEKPGPDKKRPYTNYEVTETIPYDTKTMRPKPQRPVYPLPPPCPGAPPPTFPPPDPPSTMKPPPPPHPTFPPPPPVPTFPQFPKVFPDSPVFSEHDFLESYFPTSFMSTASSFPRMSARLPGRRNYRAHQRYTQDGDESHRITRVARPRTVVRYHKPASVIIRKVHHSSSPETVILRKRNGPVKQVREVHIHHHHDRPPSPVVHIHRDDGEGVDTGRLKANGPSQRLRSSTTGPFAEPPTDLRAGKRVAAKA